MKTVLRSENSSALAKHGVDLVLLTLWTYGAADGVPSSVHAEFQE
jgi:hypothetical protein